MKIITVVSSLLSLILAAFTYMQVAADMHAVDYERIMHYVAKVEKEGFSPKDFGEFAYECKVMRKNVYIAPGLIRFTLASSIALSAIAIMSIVFPVSIVRKIAEKTGI